MRSGGILVAALALALGSCSDEGGRDAVPEVVGSSDFRELVSDARIAMQAGNLAQAGRYYDEALALDPDSAQLWVDIARLRFRGGEHLIAIEAADRALALDPAHPGALLMRAQIVRDTHGLTESLAWFEAASAADPRNPEILADHAATLGDLGRYREMLAVIRALAEVDPGYPQVHFQQAVLAARAEDPVLASTLLRRSGQSGRQVPAALMLDAIVNLQQGNYDTAATTLEALADARPGNIRVNELLARALWLGGREREIIERFAGRAEAADASPYLVMLVGRAYERVGEREAGLSLIERAWAMRGSDMVSLAPAPGDPAATFTLRERIVAGNLSAARASADALINRLPHSGDVRALAGDADLASGDLEGALEHYAATAQVRRSWPLTRKIVAAYRALGEKQAAEALLVRTIRGDPHNIEALLLYARLSAAREDWLRTVVLLDTAIGLGAAGDLEVLALRAEAASALGRETEAARFDALRGELKPGDFTPG